MKKNKCSHCGSKNDLIKYARSVVKGKVYQYFQCRRCNNDRMIRYYATPQGRLNVQQAVYRCIAKHPERQGARVKLRLAVKSGKILKPRHCHKCKGTKNIQGHHEDYAKPLEVIWMCRQCHADYEKKKRTGKTTSKLRRKNASAR